MSKYESLDQNDVALLMRAKLKVLADGVGWDGDLSKRFIPHDRFAQHTCNEIIELFERGSALGIYGK